MSANPAAPRRTRLRRTRASEIAVPRAPERRVREPLREVARPQAPRVLVSPPPSAEEAAAVIAAIERFRGDQASASPARPDAAAHEPMSQWKRTALVEGVERFAEPAALWL